MVHSIYYHSSFFFILLSGNTDVRKKLYQEFYHDIVNIRRVASEGPHIRIKNSPISTDSAKLRFSSLKHR